MAYALLQKHLAPLEVDRLKRAFHGLPGRCEIDAHNTAHEAHGIFLRGLDVETASALQDALLREGLDTWVVAESELPAIPPAKIIRQVEFLAQHLTLYDPMNRTYEVPWKEIMFLAAGKVRLTELRRAKPAHAPHAPTHQPHPPHPAASATNVPAPHALGDLHDHLLLDIILMNGSTRYSINADEFMFDHLGARCLPELHANLSLLIQDLVKCAPHAGLNRGALLLNDGPDAVFAYPNKAAFFAEMTWMLWRIDKLSRREEI